MLHEKDEIKERQRWYRWESSHLSSIWEVTEIKFPARKTWYINYPLFKSDYRNTFGREYQIYYLANRTFRKRIIFINVLQVHRIDYSYWITVTNLIQRFLKLCKETFLNIAIHKTWVIWIKALHQKNIFSQKILK